MNKRPILLTICVIVIALSLAGLYITNAALFDPACMGQEFSTHCN